MSYIGTQPNDVKKNTGLYTPSEILQLTKVGSWGGSLELIAESTFTGVTEVIFSDIKEDVYDVHYVELSDMQHTSANKFTFVQFYESGVLESGSVYMYAQEYGQSNATFGRFGSTGNNYIYITWANHGTATGDNGGAYLYLYNLGDSTKFSQLTQQNVFMDSGTMKMAYGGGLLPQTSLVDGLRFSFNTATSDGTIKIYGIKQI